MTPAGVRRLALFALAAVAAFSVIFTQIAQAGRWPPTPSNFLHDTDLWIGIAAGAALLVLLLRFRGPASPPPI